MGFVAVGGQTKVRGKGRFVSCLVCLIGWLVVRLLVVMACLLIPSHHNTHQLITPIDISQVVVVFRLSDGGSICDVRNTQGVKFSKNKSTRIKQMIWASGAKVEARFEQRKFFYKATIVKRKLAADGVQELFR